MVTKFVEVVVVQLDGSVLAVLVFDLGKAGQLHDNRVREGLKNKFMEFSTDPQPSK